MFKMGVYVAFGLSMVAPVCLSAATSYPENPVQSERAIFVSHEGIARIDRRTGAMDWQALVGEQTFEPVVAAGRVLAGTSAGLVALEPRSGDVVWRRFTGGIVFTPTVNDGLAYVAGRDGRLRAFDLTRDEVRWSRRFEGWIYPPALQDGLLITGGQQATLWALDPSTGDVEWERPLRQELVYRPIAGERLVFVTTFAGELLAVDPRDGRIRWRHRDDVASASLTADDRFVYLGRLDGVLQIFDQATGERRYRGKLGQGALHPVRIGDGRIAVADRASLISVLSIPDFRIVWQRRLETSLLASPLLERGQVSVIGSGYCMHSFDLPSEAAPVDSQVP